MKKLEKRSIHSKDVDVESEQLTAEGGHVIEVVAKIGAHEHRHRMTIGSVDEPLPDNYDLAQLQADVEKAKDHAAKMAESKDRKAKLVEQLFSE